MRHSKAAAWVKKSYRQSGDFQKRQFELQLRGWVPWVNSSGCYHVKGCVPRKYLPQIRARIQTTWNGRAPDSQVLRNSEANNFCGGRMWEAHLSSTQWGESPDLWGRLRLWPPSEIKKGVDGNRCQERLAISTFLNLVPESMSLYAQSKELMVSKAKHVSPPLAYRMQCNKPMVVQTRTREGCRCVLPKKIIRGRQKKTIRSWYLM